MITRSFGCVDDEQCGSQNFVARIIKFSSVKLLCNMCSKIVHKWCTISVIMLQRVHNSCISPPQPSTIPTIVSAVDFYVLGKLITHFHVDGSPDFRRMEMCP